MENDFETMVSGFISENVGIADHFLSDELATHLKKNLLSLHKKKLLLPADGAANTPSAASDAGGEVIYSIDRVNAGKHEHEFLDRVDDFVKYLNRSCFAGIIDHEFHYSLYESGSFYQKRREQFLEHPGRKFFMTSYLNENWKDSDGGQLKVYQSYNDKKISPAFGKSVFFKSNELQHEMLVTNEPLLSIRGWLKSGG